MQIINVLLERKTKGSLFIYLLPFICIPVTILNYINSCIQGVIIEK